MSKKTQSNYSQFDLQRAKLFVGTYIKFLNLNGVNPKNEADKAVAAFDEQFPSSINKN